ncbi:hypothetical protein BC938DRAFT_478895 [Jimgerdemannia flammicorona]|uniref:Uncharacterized protein n=1 Tax=Jimgerdemannia flammicorona TaxID=994334 RepID=A0A433QM41_9FUNG|nr:hypothetical protein BC938DRAFT_478895 [Jimgerdemannia flammicorona]
MAIIDSPTNSQTQEIMPTDNFQQPLREMETNSHVLVIFEKLQQCMAAFNCIFLMTVDDDTVTEIIGDINMHGREFNVLIEETSQYARSASIYTQDIQSLLELVAPGCSVSDTEDFLDGLQDLIDEAKKHHDISERFQKGFHKLTSDLRNIKGRLQTRAKEIEQEIVKISDIEELNPPKTEIYQKLAMSGVTVGIAAGLLYQYGVSISEAAEAKRAAEMFTNVAENGGIIGWLTGETARAAALAQNATQMASSANSGDLLMKAVTSGLSSATFLGEALDLKRKREELERRQTTLRTVIGQIHQLTADVVMANKTIRGFDNFWTQMVGYLLVVKRQYDTMKETGTVRRWEIKTVIKKWKAIELNYALYANNVGMILDGLKVVGSSDIDSGHLLLLNSS